MDFDKLVLTPAIAILGDRFTFYPRVSLPDADPVSDLRGVFEGEHVHAEIIEGVEHSTVVPKIGVKLSDFSKDPEEGDELIMQSGANAGKRYVVFDIQPDGEGGAELIMNLVD